MSPRVAEGRRGPEGAGRYAEERLEEDGEAGRAPRGGSGGVQEEEGAAGGAGEVEEGYDEDDFEEELGTEVDESVSEVGVMRDIEARHHPPQCPGSPARRGCCVLCAAGASADGARRRSRRVRRPWRNRRWRRRALGAEGLTSPPPPFPPVLIGHAASLTPY